MAKDQNLARLERLPPEVRNRIYRYAVVRDEPHNLTPIEDEVQVVDPALAMVNKSIRAEVLPVFYGCNSFMVDICDWQGKATDQPVVTEWMTRQHDRVKFMKHVAAYLRTWIVPKPQLSVTICEDGTLEIKFKNQMRRESRCLCSIHKLEANLGDLPIHQIRPILLLIGCIRDLQQTIVNERANRTCDSCTKRRETWTQVSLDPFYTVD